MRHAWEEIKDTSLPLGLRIKFVCSLCGCIKKRTSTGIKYYRKDIENFRSHAPKCKPELLIHAYNDEQNKNIQ